MIWLASFPRSGNTFFRNLLYEVYSIESTDFYPKKLEKGNKDWLSFPIVKTHLLPSQLPATGTEVKSIYLIREGRDATLSLMHHKREIKKKTQGKYQSLIEIIFGWRNLYKTSWSGHVKSWESKADIIIKFEDLIKDPIHEIEKLRKIMHLPAPNIEKIPTFESQKSGNARYGVDKLNSKERAVAKKSFSAFFRSGKVGAYKKEMPLIIQILFLLVNYRILKKYYPK